VLFGIFVIGLSLILMNYINSLWAFYVVWGVLLGTGCNIGLAVPLDTAITNWFVKKRGAALSIKWVLSGLSGVLVVPLIAWLIITQGWRTTCVIGGLVMWIFGFPLAWFCLKRHRPEYYGLLPDGTTTEEVSEIDRMINKGVEYAAGVEEREFTLRQAMRTPTYWLLITAHTSHGLVTGAINIHCIPFLTDIGIDSLSAAGMMAILLFASLPARLIGGLIADRVKRDHLRLLIGGSYFIQAIGFTAYLLNQTIPMIYVWFVLYGLGMGASFILFVTLVARYFGRKAFGSIEGSKMLFMAPVGIIAPIYAGWVYDTTGNYISAFIVFTVALIISFVLISMARPPKPPAQVTDVRKIV
jgi:MFS family permease